MMKYYYKIFVREGVEDSLKYIKANDAFIKELTEDSDFKECLNSKMTEFFVAYDVQKIRKGKSAWNWCPEKGYYSKGDWTYKGEVHPHRKDKISDLKKLWEDNV